MCLSGLSVSMIILVPWDFDDLFFIFDSTLDLPPPALPQPRPSSTICSAFASMTVPTPHNEADDEDMSIESASDEDEGEQVEPLPTIQLSFDNSKGGAWDDRELVNAYDTAIEEFHVSFGALCGRTVMTNDQFSCIIPVRGLGLTRRLLR